MQRRSDRFKMQLLFIGVKDNTTCGINLPITIGIYCNSNSTAANNTIRQDIFAHANARAVNDNGKQSTHANTSSRSDAQYATP